MKKFNLSVVLFLCLCLGINTSVLAQCQIEIGTVVINEIMYNSLEDDQSLSAGEWFEIYNHNTFDVDLTGWIIEDGGGNQHTIFSPNGPVILPPLSYFVLAEDGACGPVDYLYTGVPLNNGGDVLSLLCSSGTVVDKVDYSVSGFPPSTNGTSIGFNPILLDGVNDDSENDLGTNWCLATSACGSERGTPQNQNDGCGGLIINEVDFCDDIVQIELYNCGPTQNISDWFLCNRPAYDQIGSSTNVSLISGNLIMLPGAYTVLSWTRAGTSGAHEIGLYSSSSFNSPSAIVDYVQYGGVRVSSRAATAIAAGVWADVNDFVDYPVCPNSIGIFTGDKFPTDTDVTDWCEMVETLGMANGNCIQTDDCMITDAGVTVSPCDPTTNTFKITINPSAVNSPSGAYRFQINGGGFGSAVPYGTPSMSGMLAADGTTTYDIIIVDAGDPNCRLVVPTIVAPDPCQIPNCDLQPGQVVITEIMKNPAVIADGNGEWFEVYNPTSVPVNLIGATIRDEKPSGTDSHVIAANLFVPAMGYAVLGINADMATNGGVMVDYEYTNFTLGNGADEVIIECQMVIIDSVGYDDANYPDNAGASMIFDPLLLDGVNDIVENDDPKNWCESVTNYDANNKGTPRNPNDACDQCSITGSGLIVSNCDPNTNTFTITIDPTANNSPSGQYVFQVNGGGFGSPVSYGTASTIGPLPADGSSTYDIEIADAGDPDCTLIISNITAPDPCDDQQECMIIASGLEVFCDMNGNVVVQITPQAVGSPSGQYNFSFSGVASGGPVGPIPYGVTAPVYTGFASGGTLTIFIEDAGNPDCVLRVSVTLPEGCPPKDLQLNEILINPPSSDDNYEFVELRGAPSTSFNDIWLVFIEGDLGSANPGEVEQAIDLTGLSTGTNGLFLLREDDMTGAALPFVPAVDLATVVATDPDLDLENGTSTILLVQSYTGMAGADIDTNDDGLIDSYPWAIVLDAISIEDSAGFPYAALLGGLDMPESPSGADADAVFRTRDTREWLGVELDDNAANPGLYSNLDRNEGEVYRPDSVLVKLVEQFLSPGNINTVIEPCPEDQFFINVDLVTATYEVQDTIEASGSTNVLVGETVVFDAGTTVILKPDFTAPNGSTFTARIGGCSPIPVASDEEIEARSDEVKVTASTLKVAPNPFEGSTTIRYFLPASNVVNVGIFDLNGKQVRQLVTNTTQKDWQQLDFDATDLEAGIYMLIVQTEGQTMVEKLSIIK